MRDKQTDKHSKEESLYRSTLLCCQDVSGAPILCTITRCC